MIGICLDLCRKECSIKINFTRFGSSLSKSIFLRTEFLFFQKFEIKKSVLIYDLKEDEFKEKAS